MADQSKAAKWAGYIKVVVFLMVVVMIIVISNDHPAQEASRGSVSYSTRTVNRTEKENSSMPTANSSSDEEERSRRREELRERLETIREKSETPVGEISYPDDPYHVFDYDDPDAFWWDWGDEFDNYDDCYEYWDRAWGNLK